MNGFQQCESLRRQSLCAVEHAAEITLVSRVLKATLLRPAVVYIVYGFICCLYKSNVVSLSFQYSATNV
jgi:hypothetical protein